MEELANLIWVLGSVAEIGPPEFQDLWKEMYHFLVHYIYGYSEDSHEDRELAHRAIHQYAELLEIQVIRKKV